MYPALAGGFFTTEPPGKAPRYCMLRGDVHEEKKKEARGIGREAFSIGWLGEDPAEEETFEQRLEGGEEVSMQLCIRRHASERGQIAEAWRWEYVSCLRLKE